MKHVALFMRVLVLLFWLPAVGCDAAKLAPAWVRALVVDPPLPPPVSIVIACDHSVGATCGEAELAANVEASLQVAAARPYSRVALWSVGSDVAREVARVDSPAASDRGDRARAAQQRVWIERSRAELLAAAQTIFSSAPPHASPIAESISAIRLAVRGPLILVFSTDTLQYSRDTFDFECKKLPEPGVFLARLQALSLLAPGSLTDTSVFFANARISQSVESRCPLSIARTSTIRALWSSAITNGGGTVTFTADSVTPADLGGAQ